MARRLPSMAVDAKRDLLDRALADGDGILRMEPAWVARDWLPAGRRLGLPERAYDVGERGTISERWLASTTKADNRVGPPDEGLSYIATDGPERMTLKEAVSADPVSIMGADYAATHDGLGRLAKIFDFGARIPYHLHQRQQHAELVGRHSKDEAYYFLPGVDMGPHPETFLGVHPWLAQDRAYDTFLPFLTAWDSDLIVQHAPAFRQVHEEGFEVPSGVLHAPGTALTLELQEDSDVLAMLQALNAGVIIDKELLWKDVRPIDRQEKGERFILELIDWEANGDPYFYENHHLVPRPIEETRQEGCEESWIFYNNRRKFSGKRVLVDPGCSFTSVDRGVYNILVWRGSGSYGGLEVKSGQPEIDELLVTHHRAVRGVEVRNTGREQMLIVKFFGPDINPDAPMIKRR
jgi:hypothetical protein